MLATRFNLRKHRLEVAWGLFALANVLLMVLFPAWEGIPFHLMWISLTLVGGIRGWSTRATVVAVLVVAPVTAVVYLLILDGRHLVEELIEVPLMAAMFLGMVWCGRRRQAAAAEVRQLADGLRRILDRQREFVRNASHGLRTPITVARGHAELIQAASADTQVVEDARIVLDELARLSRLSEGLLILAAADHEEFLRTEPLQVRPFIIELARRWSSTARRAWEVEASAEGSVPADEERLEVAVEALIENAVKFTGEDDTIAIRAREQEGELVIEVADTGSGIAPRDTDRVFQPFARAEGRTTRGRGGTGLGLAIVRAITEAHGGGVELASEVGRGSSFRIRLPGFEPDPLAEVAHPATFEPSTS